MLDVVGRPIALGRHVVTLVEQGIERLEDERLVFRWSRLLHVVLLIRGYLERWLSLALRSAIVRWRRERVHHEAVLPPLTPMI